MKGLKVNMDMVNCGLLCVVLVLVVMCCVKREGFVGAPLNSNEHSQIEMFYGNRLKGVREKAQTQAGWKSTLMKCRKACNKKAAKNCRDRGGGTECYKPGLARDIPCPGWG
jgi:hypothetical protein